MARVDNNVVNLVEKIRKAIREGMMQPDNFPLDEISNLIECTLGASFWKYIVSESNYGFANLPGIYKECLQEAVKRKDMEECGRILYLFQCSYISFYTAMSDDEKVFRQKPYRKMIIELGTANAQMQCRIHKERQKGLVRKEDGRLGQGRGVVYTFLTGEKKLNQPEEASAQVDYLCFTDKEDKWGKKEGVWEYRPAEKTEGMGIDYIRSKYTIMAHQMLPEYDYSVWVDPDMVVVGDLFRFCKVYGEKNSFLCFPDAKEDCIYEDMSVVHMRTDHLNIAIRKKLLQFQKEGYPEHNGLIDNRVIIRDHRSRQMRETMEAWWREIYDGHSIAKNIFNYVAWKQQFPFSLCDLFIYENPYFKNGQIDLNTNEDY